MSVIQYGVSPKVEFKLNQFTTKEAMITAASRITQMYGTSTNTFHAIQYARLVFFFFFNQHFINMHMYDLFILY